MGQDKSVEIVFEGAMFKWIVNGVKYKTLIQQNAEQPTVTLFDENDVQLGSYYFGDIIDNPYAVKEGQALMNALDLYEKIPKNKIVLTDGVNGKNNGGSAV